MKSSKSIEPAIGIIVTQPEKFFEQYDRGKWLTKMAELNTSEGQVWHRVMAKLPTQDVLYVFTAYDGQVQFRCNLVEMFRNRDMKFPRPEGGIRTFENASGIVLGPPFVIRPKGLEAPMQGFQGFRYVSDTYVQQNLW